MVRRSSTWMGPMLVLPCLLTTMLPASVRAAGEPYEINVILALTGTAGFAGQSNQEALRALEAKVNKAGGIDGRPIKFVVHDDGTNAANAVQIASELIAQKVPLIIGSTLVSSCAAMAPLAKDGPLIYCLSNGVHPVAGSYLFSGMEQASDLVAAAIHYERMKGAKRVASIVTTDASGQDGENGLDLALARPENRGMTVVAREHFNPTDISVAAQLARIKAANPDLLYSWSSGTPAGTVLRGFNELGLDIPVITSSANASYGQMKQYASFLPKQLIFGVPAALLAPDQIANRAVRSAVQDFVDAMAAQNERPDLLAVGGWDPSLLVITALKKIGLANVTPDRLRSYLASVKGFAGADGVYDFPAVPQRGLDLSQTYVVRWDAGKGTWVGVSKAGGDPL